MKKPYVYVYLRYVYNTYVGSKLSYKWDYIFLWCIKGSDEGIAGDVREAPRKRSLPPPDHRSLLNQRAHAEEEEESAFNGREGKHEKKEEENESLEANVEKSPRNSHFRPHHRREKAARTGDSIDLRDGKTVTSKIGCSYRWIYIVVMAFLVLLKLFWTNL